MQFLDLKPEAKSSNLRTLPLTLSETPEGLRVLQSNGLDATNIVKVSGVLVVGHILRELGLLNEVACLLVQVLQEVAPNDDVHHGSLADLVLVQATCLVVVKHGHSDLWQDAHLLVCHRGEVHCLCTKVEQGWLAHSFQSQNDEVTKFLGLYKDTNRQVLVGVPKSDSLSSLTFLRSPSSISFIKSNT